MLCRTTFFRCCTRFADKVYVVHVYFCILLDYSAIIPPENKFYKSRFSITIATIVTSWKKGLPTFAQPFRNGSVSQIIFGAETYILTLYHIYLRFTTSSGDWIHGAVSVE